MINPENFRRTINGRATNLYIIKNNRSLEAAISNYGARIIDLVFAGINVTPAFPSLDEYASATIAPYHGAAIGRYANRIAKARFILHGKEYSLALNNTPNHLHGGPGGFHHQVWEVSHVAENSIELSYFSKDGEEGYPGNVTTSIIYTVSDEDELIVDYKANTDSSTPFNITNHAFFNLNGEGSVLKHRLQINADNFTPVDETLIPTGSYSPVIKTPFDFRAGKTIGKDIDKDDPQLKTGAGYDHNFILNKTGEEMSFAAKAIGDKTGIVMEVYTTEPGMQLFSGNFETVKGDAATYRNTFCLETQHFPDSPNQPQFPSTILHPGDTFTSRTIYKFRK